MGRGGAEMLLPETIRLHNSNQFEFHCIYFLPWKDQLVKTIQKTGTKVTCFKASNNMTILLQYRRLVNYIRKEKIQIVHCHLPWAAFVGRLLHKFNGIHLIYSEHNKQERYHPITAAINKYSFNWQNSVIAVSEDVKLSILKNIEPIVQVKTVLNGVNTERFNRQKYSAEEIRQKLNIKTNDPVIGNVAVFRTQKRLDLWIEQAAIIKAKFANAHFILVGDGPTQPLVHTKINDLGLTDCVHLPGRLEEVRPWLAAMDIFLISSKFEGLPIALLEALSMEVAVVTTNAGGIKEVIKHKENGWIVDIDSPNDLSLGVISLLSDAKQKNQLAGSGRRTIEEDFSINKMVNSLEKEYLKAARE